MHNECIRCGRILKNRHSLVEHLKKPKVCPPKKADIDRQSIIDKLPVRKPKKVSLPKPVVNPVETIVNQVEPIVNPVVNQVEPIVNPVVTIVNPVETIVNPVEIVVNPVEPVVSQPAKEEKPVEDDPISRIKADLLLTGSISQKDFFMFLDKLDAKVHERLTEIEDMYRERFEKLNLANAAILTKFTERYNNEMLDIKELYQSFLVLVKK